MAAERARTRGRRIILANPDPAARAAAAEALRAGGFSVVEAATRAEAETAFWAEPNTELLIAAFDLPGAGGPRLAGSLLALRPGLKVLLVTADGPSPGRREDVPAGLHCIPRPPAVDGLLAAVRDVLGSR